ncbi:MAG: hypothetical protein COA78_23700 [Blastopirellula sp.]|nr:MAG: hypothetical protein COA78_23700 [Blastopirellula sp.]
MSRYSLLIVVVMAAGCQNPNQPFNPYGNTRVPPPPTGSYGQPATTAPYYNVPPATSGAPGGAPSVGGASFQPNPALQTNQFPPPPAGQWGPPAGAAAPPATGYAPAPTSYPTSPAPAASPNYGQPPVGTPPQPAYNGTSYRTNIN